MKKKVKILKSKIMNHLINNDENLDIEKNIVEKKTKLEKEDKMNQTFENKDKQIEYLEEQLKEKERIIKELNEKLTNNNKEEELNLGNKIEIEKLNEENKKNINELENKIVYMKTMVKE